MAENNSNDDSVFVCEICTEQKTFAESFSIKGCTHSYCSECTTKYTASMIEENMSQISCPVSGSEGVLEPEDCSSILPPEVFVKWGDALCEALMLASNKFYCPYADCSALLIRDGVDSSDGIMESECPVCHRLFCAQCQVPWHSGVECGEFQKLHEDEREKEDILFMQFAKDKKWTRCSQCKFFVERSAGCLFMTCRCGFTFCYNCGAPVAGHYCENCKH